MVEIVSKSSEGIKLKFNKMLILVKGHDLDDFENECFKDTLSEYIRFISEQKLTPKGKRKRTVLKL